MTYQLTGTYLVPGSICRYPYPYPVSPPLFPFTPLSLILGVLHNRELGAIRTGSPEGSSLMLHT